MNSDEKMKWALRAIWIGAAIFLVRTFLLGSIPDFTLETCHTGGIANEIMSHGIRFPWRAYTPENYENGIVIEGLMAIPFFVIFGKNALALKLLAHLVALVMALMAVALLERVMAAMDLGDRRSRSVAVLACVVALVLAPAIINWKMQDPLGDHNEGAALNLVLLVLLLRRVERPTLKRFTVLWLCAGFFVFWEKGTLLAVSCAAAHELVSAYTRRTPRSWVVCAPALFMVSYLPGIYMHIATHWADVHDVAVRFKPLRLHDAPRIAERVYVVLGQNAWLAGAGLASLVFWCVQAVRRRKIDSPMPYLAGYALFSLYMTLRKQSSNSAEFIYPYPMLAIAVGAFVAFIVTWATRRLRLPFTLVAPAAVAVVVLGMEAPFQFRPSHLRQLAEDTVWSSCEWRFGQAFLRSAPDHDTALQWCRMLGGDRALRCISGMPRYSQDPVVLAELDSPEERQAWAYGVGLVSDTCERLTAPEERAACLAGQRWNCFFCGDTMARSLFGHGLGRPRCEMSAPPYSEIGKATVSGWMARAPLSTNTMAEMREQRWLWHAVVDSMPSRCRPVMPACLGIAALE